MIKVSDLLCIRNERVIFKRVAFVLQPGAALQIIGPNGAGKTTLLRVLAGLLQPESGSIVINSKPICYVGHKHNLHPALTVTQNLNFLYAMAATTTNLAASHILAALEYFKMQQFAATIGSQLSAGQQQRISLAALYLSSAKLWLLDEPLAHLDSATIRLVIDLCIKHLNSGGSIICATHAPLDLAPLTTNTLALQDYV